MLSGGIERMTDSTRKYICRDPYQHPTSDVQSDSVSRPTGHDTHSLENMTICGHISIPNHLEYFLVSVEILIPRIKGNASPPSSSLLFGISYTPWPVDNVNRQNIYCFLTQWKRSLETLRSSAHWTTLGMGFSLTAGGEQHWSVTKRWLQASTTKLYFRPPLSLMYLLISPGTI